MTIVFLQPDGVPITAQAARQGSAAVFGGGSGRPLGGRSGFRVGTASDTLTATSTVWTLKPCSVQIDPGASTSQGMYGWASDANVTGAVTASDATYARKDIVYIQVNDSSAGDGSGATTAPVLYLAGTPTATPAAPTLPARSFLVGTIDVPKTGGGVPSVTLNPARFAAAGGVLPVTSTEQAGLTQYPGLATARGGILEVSDGSSFLRAGAKVIPAASIVGATQSAAAFTTGNLTPIFQVGTAIVTTDASGYFSITYPQAFPNGVLALVPTNGDSAANGRDLIVSCAGSPFTNSVSTGYGGAVDKTGAPKANATIRINYVVAGF